MIMLRINLLLAMILFSGGYGSEIDIEKLEKYVQEEVNKQDNRFKSELERCLREAEKLGKRPDIEIQIRKIGCKPIFDKYEKLIEKATEKYSSELENQD